MLKYRSMHLTCLNRNPWSSVNSQQLCYCGSENPSSQDISSHGIGQGIREYSGFNTGGLIVPSHKSHNASQKYPTMHYFVTELGTHLHISVTKSCFVGCGICVLWDLCNISIEFIMIVRKWPYYICLVSVNTIISRYLALHCGYCLDDLQN